MEELDKDIVSLLSRRAYDIAGTTPGVKVFLNGKRLPVSHIGCSCSRIITITNFFKIKNFKEYVELYTSKMIDDNNAPIKITHEKVNPRWEVWYLCLQSYLNAYFLFDAKLDASFIKCTIYVSKQMFFNLICLTLKKIVRRTYACLYLIVICSKLQPIFNINSTFLLILVVNLL